MLIPLILSFSFFCDFILNNLIRKFKFSLLNLKKVKKQKLMEMTP